MSFDKQRIELVKGEVHESDLRMSHKADITELLMKAGTATNGCENKAQAMTEAIAALAVCFARDAMYRREDIRELMKSELLAHAKNCPLADEIPRLVTEAMKGEIIEEWNGVTERRGRDGRDGRDFVAKTPAGRFSGPAWALAVISLCAVAIVAMFKFG